MLSNNPSPFILTITPENKEYVCTCLDSYFKVTRFREHCISSGCRLKSGLLETTVTDIKVFKKMWKAFQDRFIFKKYNWLRVIGTIERGVEGEAVGLLHSHLFLDFPADISDSAIHGPINADLRRIWSDIHEEATGKPVGGNRMGIEDPEDEDGDDLARYICKDYNRGKEEAKWGLDGNESHLVTANVRKLKLWRRDELPSRNKKERDLALYTFNHPDDDDSGTLRMGEAA